MKEGTSLAKVLKYNGLSEICDRVVTDCTGYMLAPWRASDIYQANPDIVFIRDDGFTLGAPTELENVAFNVSCGQWVAFARYGDLKPRPIGEYYFEQASTKTYAAKKTRTKTSVKTH